jgi:hypothetical protein
LEVAAAIFFLLVGLALPGLNDWWPAWVLSYLGGGFAGLFTVLITKRGKPSEPGRRPGMAAFLFVFGTLTFVLLFLAFAGGWD